MDDIILRMERNIEILQRKKQEIKDGKLGKLYGNNKVADHVDRYRLNMEMVMWIVNTDALFYRHSKRYKKNKTMDKEINGIWFGVYYVFNSFKHNLVIISPEDVEKTPFFGMEGFSIANNKWLNDPNLDKEYDKKAYEAYEQYLVGKNVYEIFSRAVTFLVSQFYKIKELKPK